MKAELHRIRSPERAGRKLRAGSAVFSQDDGLEVFPAAFLPRDDASDRCPAARMSSRTLREAPRRAGTPKIRSGSVKTRHPGLETRPDAFRARRVSVKRADLSRNQRIQI